MTLSNQPAGDAVREVNEPALDAARSLAIAIGESDVFRRFESTQAAFAHDESIQARFRSYQNREQELRVAAMWGGAGTDEQMALQREWRELSALPTLRDYLEAQDALGEMFREVAARITDGIGVDYGAACSPAGGCC